MGLNVERSNILAQGFRLIGGGTHQSKTMMISELRSLLGFGDTNPEALKRIAVEENALGKSTVNTRRQTFGHLGSLYGLLEQPPITQAMLGLWRLDDGGRLVNALLLALARDPLFRKTADVILKTGVGEVVPRTHFEETLTSAFPNRFSPKMVKSLAQNCASSWTQSGHLSGKVKKIRRRLVPTATNVAFAALLATTAGFGGPSILSSPWMKILDLSPDQALDFLRRAAALGLVRIRSAGEVTEISVRQPMATTLKVPSLEHV